MTHRVGFIMVPTLAIAERDVAKVRRDWDPRDLAAKAATTLNPGAFIEAGANIASLSLAAAGAPFAAAERARREIAAAAHSHLAQLQAGKNDA